MKFALALIALVAAIAAAQTFPLNIANWQFRVVDGFLDDVSGRLEMRPDPGANWGGVCRAGFTENEAKAVCRQLGVPIPDGKDVTFFPAFLEEGSKMWLSNVSCSTDELALENCTYQYSSSGAACDPLNNLGIDCITGTPSPTFGPSVIFVATFQPTVSTYTTSGFNLTFINSIAAFYEIAPSRLMVTSINKTDTPLQYVITFQFTDTTNTNAMKKEHLEVLLPQNQWSIFGTDLGFVSIISNVPPTPAPSYLNMSDWQFRLVDGSAPWVGRLEVKAGASAQWGTVCGAGFGVSEAFAACGSLGYSTASATMLKFFNPSGTGLIALSDVSCLLGQSSLSTCTMKVSTPENDLTNCIHTEDVGVDCYFNITPPAPSDVPGTPNPADNAPVLLWTAVVYTYDITPPSWFRSSLAMMVQIAESRIVITDIHEDPADSSLTYCSFYFTDGHPPRLSYDYELNSINPQGLVSMAGIVQLTNNATQSHLTVAPGMDFKVHWNTQLSDPSNKRGLITVQPWITNTTTNVTEKGFDWGTVCPWEQLEGEPKPINTFFIREAAAACLSAGFNVSAHFEASSRAAAIPYFTNNGLGAIPGQTGPIYLSSVRCDLENNLDQCQTKLSLPEAKTNNCTHITDLGAICIPQLASAPAEPNTNVTTYHATMSAESIDEEFIWTTMSFYIPLHLDRFKVTDVVYQNGGNTAVLSFFFMDVFPNTTGVSRQDLDYWFQHISATGLQKLFGFTQVLMTQGAPDWIPTKPPDNFISQNGWTYRVLGASDTQKKGLLQVKTGAASEWGTVCGKEFTTIEAIAACNSAGLPTTFALAYTDHPDQAAPGTPISLSHVYCRQASVDKTLGNCSVYLFSDETFGCDHNDDVVLDCQPNPDDLDPVMFTAVMKTQNFTESLFRERFAYFYETNLSRILINGTTSYESFTYVNFSFSEGPQSNDTIVEPPENGQETDPAEEFPVGPDEIGPDSPPGHDLAESDRVIFDRMTLGLDPTTLFFRFGIYELRNNMSSLKGDLQASHNDWRFRMVNGGNQTEATWYGRLEVQPGSTAPWGTLCGSAWNGQPYSPLNSFASDMNNAVSMCRMFRKDVTHALMVPNYVRYGSGIIYVSGVGCPAFGAPLSTTNLSRDEFFQKCTFTTSKRYEKNNNCTHNDDIGLICGQDVDNSPNRAPRGMTTLFHGRFLFQGFVVDTFKQKLASAIGIDHRRINVTEPLFDQENKITMLNFSFFEHEVIESPTGVAFTAATLDLYLQSFNVFGLYTHFNMTTLTWSYIPTFLPHTPQPAPANATCVYTEWTPWSACSVSCGGGIEISTREIVVNNGGVPCPGPLIRNQPCNTQSCPPTSAPAPVTSSPTGTTPAPTEVCQYSAWSSWSACSVPCGPGGEEFRTRKQIANHGGVPCPGPLRQTQPCNANVPCPSTSVPAVTTSTPVTPMPSGSTAEPATPAPSIVTSAPTPVTNAPSTSSSAPGTAAPVSTTTMAPVATTSSPTSTTGSPTTGTASPTAVTASPTTVTGSPVTASPMTSTNVPLTASPDGTAAPVSSSSSAPTVAPSVSTAAPITTPPPTTSSPSTQVPTPLPSGATLAPVTPMPSTSRPATPQPSTMAPPPPNSINLVIDGKNTKTDAEIAQEIAAAIKVPVGDVTIVSETNKNGDRVVTLQLKDKKEVDAAVNLPTDTLSQLGVKDVTRAAADGGDDAPAPSSDGPPIAIIAGAAAGAVVVIAVVGFIVFKVASSKKEAKYDDSYVAMLQHSGSGGGIGSTEVNGSMDDGALRQQLGDNKV